MKSPVLVSLAATICLAASPSVMAQNAPAPAASSTAAPVPPPPPPPPAAPAASAAARRGGASVAGMAGFLSMEDAQTLNPAMLTAIQDPAVQAAQKAYNDALRTALSKDPAAKAILDRNPDANLVISAQFAPMVAGGGFGGMMPGRRAGAAPGTGAPRAGTPPVAPASGGAAGNAAKPN